MIVKFASFIIWILFCRHDIRLAGWSSDGDPKLLASMCHLTLYNEDFHFIQDMTHIATKLRNRLLNEKVTLTMGSKTASIKHLKELIKNVNKSIHGLNPSDVSPFDRQNYKSFRKIIEDRVLEALNVNIKNCEGTVKYLQICCDITRSFLDTDLKPLDRIFLMYHSVYFLRIWKNWIKSSRCHNLKANFISHNAHTCIEMNAFHLIGLIKKFRSENMPQLFLPTIFDSQTCEKTFRQLRSMGTMDFTRINFSIYDLVHMIGRIEIQNEIAYFKLIDDIVSFPISHKRTKKTQTYELPSDDDINATLEKAKNDAIKDALVFGMQPGDIDSHEFRSKIFVEENHEEELGNDEEDEYLLDEEEEGNEYGLDNDSDFDEDEHPLEALEPHTPFTSVVDENGDTRLIRISTLVWLLTEPGAIVSKDRLRRVQVNKKRKT